MSREFWQQYNLRLEPWGMEFDTPIQWADDAAMPSQVKLELEQADWVACDANSTVPAPRSLYFIDGRRCLGEFVCQSTPSACATAGGFSVSGLCDLPD